MGYEEEIIRLRKICNQTKLKVYDEIKNLPLSINDLSKTTKIDYKNVSRYIYQLQKDGIIDVFKTTCTIRTSPIMVKIKK